MFVKGLSAPVEAYELLEPSRRLETPGALDSWVDPICRA